jgi:hypothetical protein
VLTFVHGIPDVPASSPRPCPRPAPTPVLIHIQFCQVPSSNPAWAEKATFFDQIL